MEISLGNITGIECQAVGKAGGSCRNVSAQGASLIGTPLAVFCSTLTRLGRAGSNDSPLVITMPSAMRFHSNNDTLDERTLVFPTWASAGRPDQKIHSME
ncbi:hypothetical protein J6590_013902 [Homalodisca vitripennis]|nr:hypothetical protein J6590_013902 [Homalodisca vitripennis]